MTYLPTAMMAAQLLGTVIPPPVAQSSAVGTGTKAAREDHTHQSSVQAQRLQVTPDASGTATWTFPQAFPTGVVPVVVATAETPSAATYRNAVSVVEGTVTNTGCQIKIVKINQSIIASLLGAVIGVFSAQTAATYVELWARKATT